MTYKSKCSMTVKWEILFKKRETSFPCPCFLWLECILDGWSWSSHQEPQGRNYVAAGQQQNKNEFRFFTPWSNLICFDCLPPDVISMGGKQIRTFCEPLLFTVFSVMWENLVLTDDTMCVRILRIPCLAHALKPGPVLSNRAFCDDGTARYLCSPIQAPLATCD